MKYGTKYVHTQNNQTYPMLKKAPTVQRMERSLSQKQNSRNDHFIVKFVETLARISGPVLYTTLLF